MMRAAIVKLDAGRRDELYATMSPAAGGTQVNADLLL